jgi:hypothetical protein
VSSLHTKRVRLRIAVGFSASLALIALACGPSGPPMGRVYGTVTYQGKPVTKGTIAFISTDPNRSNASSPIDSDGSYTLQTVEPGDGAQVGDYRVTITGKDPDALNTPLPGEPVKVKSDVPAKYENPQTSGLTATVAAGSNKIPFDLK